MITDPELHKLLKDSSYLEDTDLDKAARNAREEELSLYQSLVKLDLISDENLGKLIADYFKVPYIKLAKSVISNQALNILNEEFAREHKVIVFEADKKEIKLATPDPRNLDLIAMIAKKISKEPKVFYATERDVLETLNLYKKDLQNVFSDLLKVDFDESGKVTNPELPIAKIVDTILEYAFLNKASDIHIEPGDEYSLIRFRVDGILHDQIKLPKIIHDQVITRIKVKSRLRTDEHLSAQDGKMQLQIGTEKLDIRVSTVPIVEGEKCVMRLLTSNFRQFGLTDLGMNKEALAIVKAGFQKPYGMVLSTGPTGSGKTTSMYAILKIINTRERNIATIEDPVEYDIKGINQIQVNPKTNLTFAEGLRSILRQDPDVIYVGEIRDEDTAGIAINSAMTGHLVLSTLHTNDAATSLPRLIEMGIEPFLVASTVNVIIGQRLVRKICDKCKVSHIIDRKEIEDHISKDLVKIHFGVAKEIRTYLGKGCPVCHNSGYDGRIGVFEVLQVSEAIEKLIVAKADSDDIEQQAIKEGMKTMLEDGLDKIQQGQTTLEEVLRVTRE